MCKSGNLKQKLLLKDFEIFACIFSAIIHDFKHPGLNNFYQINAKTPISLIYNGIYI